MWSFTLRMLPLQLVSGFVFASDGRKVIMVGWGCALHKAWLQLVLALHHFALKPTCACAHALMCLQLARQLLVPHLSLHASISWIVFFAHKIVFVFYHVTGTYYKWHLQILLASCALWHLSGIISPQRLWKVLCSVC